MAVPDATWVQACATATGYTVASTRGGLSDGQDVEVPSVILQRDGGGDITRFLDNPLLFANILARSRAEADAMAARVDSWFRYELPAGLRLRRCLSAFSEIGDQNTSGVINYAATYDCVTHN